MLSCWAKSESLHTLQVNQSLTHCKKDCLREASSTFGVDAQYKGMELRGKGSIREWDEDEKVVKDSKLLIEGDPYDSGYPEVVRVSAEDKLEQFADRVQTRILEGREEKGNSAEDVTKQQQKYCDFVQTNAQSFQKFLDKSGLAACYNLKWVAEKGSDPHTSCNSKLHSNDTQLRKDAKKMGPFVKMLSKDMPFECGLVTQYGWVERNLFTLS